MKQLTKDELLNSTLRELGFTYAELGGRPIIEHSEPDIEFFYVESLGIEIIEEKPPITQESLCKFYLKFGEWPKAKFADCHPFNGSRNFFEGRLISWEGDYPISGDFLAYEECEIIDERWTEIGE